MNKRNGLLTGFKLPVDVEFCGVLNRKKSLHTGLLLFFIRQNVPVNRIPGA